MNDSETHSVESTGIIEGIDAILDDWIRFPLRAKFTVTLPLNQI